MLNTRGGLNNLGSENIFWKLISDGVLFNNGVGNSYKTSPFYGNQEDKCTLCSKILEGTV